MKNAESGHQENPMAAGNKLTRLKQTLTTGLQQAQDSGKILVIINYSPIILTKIRRGQFFELVISSSFDHN